MDLIREYNSSSSSSQGNEDVLEHPILDRHNISSFQNESETLHFNPPATSTMTNTALLNILPENSNIAWSTACEISNPLPWRFSMTNEQWHTANQDIADENNVNEDITNGPNTLYISANSHDAESNLDSRSSESTCNTDSSELVSDEDRTSDIDFPDSSNSEIWYGDLSGDQEPVTIEETSLREQCPSPNHSSNDESDEPFIWQYSYTNRGTQRKQLSLEDQFYSYTKKSYNYKNPDDEKWEC